MKQLLQYILQRLFSRKQSNTMRFFDGRYFDLEATFDHYVNRPWNIVMLGMAATLAIVLWFAYCLLNPIF